jgi:hypothetical protein
MTFQPGQSGNPSGRPPGSLNKKTVALRAAMAKRAEEIVRSAMDRVKEGQPAAMRPCRERDPIGRKRRIAIDLPVIKTPDDADAALAVVTAALAAGDLSIAEASDLVSAIDRMLRLAERMWNFERTRRHGAARDAIVFDQERAPQGNRRGSRNGRRTRRAPVFSC